MGRAQRVIDSILVPLNMIGVAVGVAALLFRQITQTRMSAPEYRSAFAAALFAAVSFLYADRRRDPHWFVFFGSCTFLGGSTFALIAGRDLYFRIPPTGVRDGIINAALSAVCCGAFVAVGFSRGWTRAMNRRGGKLASMFGRRERRKRKIWEEIISYDRRAPGYATAEAFEPVRQAQLDAARRLYQAHEGDVEELLERATRSDDPLTVLIGLVLAVRLGLPRASQLLDEAENRLRSGERRLRPHHAATAEGQRTDVELLEAVHLRRGELS